MRLSPVLVAFCATAASFGLSESARGQTVASASTRIDSARSTAPTADQPGVGIKSPAKLLKTGMLSVQSRKPFGIAPPQSVAQSQQETPDRIQIGPGSTPTSPNIPAPTAPAPTEQPIAPDGSAPAPDQPTQPPTTPPTLELEVPTQPPPTESTPAQPTPAQPTPEQSPEQPIVPDGSTPAPEQPTQPGPPTGPGEQPTPEQPTPEQPAEAEPRVLVAEVNVQGVEGIYQDEVYRVIRTQPGRTTTRSQLQEDINAIFKTGLFSSVRAVPEDTPLGVRVTFEVALNPTLQSVQVEGATVLPQSVIDSAFSPQYGTVLNLNQLQEGIKVITKWYQDNGYVLAQVVDAPRVSPEGVVTLEVAEGVIEDIEVRFVTKEGQATDPKTGQPIRGRTRKFIVTREFEQKPGAVFNRNTAERDLQRAFGLGIFEDVKLSLNPGQDPRKVIVVANVTEKNTGNISAGAGISSASGLFGTVSYQQNNLGGNNQRLGAEVQLGVREFLFDLGFTDPWIGGDPFRTSYSVNLFRRRTTSLIFDGGQREVELDNGDTPRINRTGASLSFSRPLSRDVFRRSEWTASLGLQYQRIETTDRDNDRVSEDERGNPLTFSGTGLDDLTTIQFGVVRDRRNDPLRPTRGSLLRVGTDQSIPIGSGSILFNRLRASYSVYLPTRLIRFTKGCQGPNVKDADCPQLFAFNVQGGTVFGDLPPYEAFSLGGATSVRGYDEGELAAARSYVQGTIEYRFPIFSVFSGALFVDGATDFGSQGSVRGRPGTVRRKPGSGFGYGAGIRIQSPLGPIRIDYGRSDEGDSQFHFGIGERF